MPQSPQFPAESDRAASASHAHARPPRWMILWTVFVVVAVGCLAQPGASGLAERVLRSDGVDDAMAPAARILRGLLVAHVGLQPIYPWILAGPYLFWLGSRYPLQRGRLKSTLLIQLAATVAALGASAGYRHFVAARRPLILVWNVVETQREDSTNAGQRIPGRSLSTTGMMFLSGVSAGHAEMPGLISNALAQAERHRASTSAEAGLPATQETTVQVVQVLEDVSRTNAMPRAFGVSEQKAKDWEVHERSRSAELRAVPDVMAAAPSSSIILDLLACGALLGSSHALFFYRQSRDRERRTLALEANLARTRLHALQAQLQPHFLFNTLNSIAALLREDPRAAEEMLMSLSELLRLALAQSSRTEVPLREEIRFLELYLEIQRVRFGPRLCFETDLESAALDQSLPSLILQPLVENALRHGLEPSPDPVLVRILARCEPGALVLRVEDDGVGQPNPDGLPPKEGNGLGNVRARLAATFANGASLTYPQPAGKRGFAVEVRLPIRPAGPMEACSAS